MKNNVHPQTEKNFCQIFGQAGETEVQVGSYEAISLNRNNGMKECGRKQA
jgi:hypothetical protein